MPAARILGRTPEGRIPLLAASLSLLGAGARLAWMLAATK